MSGIYIAKLVRLDNGEASPLIFVVRNDSSHSDILVQASDTTWQAYNNYGGKKLYVGKTVGPAFQRRYKPPGHAILCKFFCIQDKILLFAAADACGRTSFFCGYNRAPQNNAITVPQADGRMRFWRNTRMATLGPGQVATLPTGVLGYESDEDVDNGFRPAGLIRLSTTTVGVSAYLYYSPSSGYYFGNGTETHHLTLYRAPSGALVFGAGTIHWSAAVENNHGGFSGVLADPNAKQATVNLLADMGVQPATLQNGLTPATASTDSTPPRSAITSPPSGTKVTTGSSITISGTAADSGGGVVGAVEISLDGGITWHPAMGRENWSYVIP